MKKIINFLARGVKVLLIDPGLRGITFLRVLTSKLSLEAPNTTFFDGLDIFSDATDLKSTLVLLFREHRTPIMDSERGYHFKIQDTIIFMKMQESCPSFAGALM